jgi:hypothetical protein
VTGSSRSKPVVEWARRLGCEAKRARSGHWRLTYNDRFVACVSSTPSDWRSTKNEKSRIRRKLQKIKESAS